LSKQFEIDAEALTLTVDTFNGNVELGGDPFGRERFGGPLEPPFHAIRVTGARWRTFGGLAVDRTAHVLDAAGRPIPGLYAAGGAAEGLGGDGTEGWLPGTDALAALALGRLAALGVVVQRLQLLEAVLRGPGGVVRAEEDLLSSVGAEVVHELARVAANLVCGGVDVDVRVLGRERDHLRAPRIADVAPHDLELGKVERDVIEVWNRPAGLRGTQGPGVSD